MPLARMAMYQISAQLDMDEIVQSKLDFDVVGHYNRPDIFDLTIRDQPEIKREIVHNS